MRAHYRRALCTVLCLMSFAATNASAAIHSCYYGTPDGASAISPTLIGKYSWTGADTFWMYDVSEWANFFQNGNQVPPYQYQIFAYMWWSFVGGTMSVWIANVPSYSNYRLDAEFQIRTMSWFSGQLGSLVVQCSSPTVPLIPQ
jgi:hypothetical protein